MQITISDIYSAIPTLTEQEIAGLADRLKRYMSRSTNVSAVSSAEDVRKEEYREQLSEIEGLVKGWDGGEAEPICDAIVKTLSDIIEYLPFDVLSQWYIVPDTNGTIALQSKQRDRFAIFSIGTNGYSYIARNGEKMIKNEKTMDITSLLCDVKLILCFINRELKLTATHSEPLRGSHPNV